MRTKTTIRLVGCEAAVEAHWAFNCIQGWVAQHDPATGGDCYFEQGSLAGFAKKTKSGFTFRFVTTEDTPNE